MKAYKFLGIGGIGLFSDFAWPPAGEWVDAAQPLADCLAGVHAVRREHLLDWIDDELWEIELAGTVVERDSMVVAERGRLVRRIAAWDADLAHEFADECARRAAGIAVAALRRVGQFAAADGLAEAENRAEVENAAASALVATRDAGVTDAVEFAADLASLVSGSRPDAWRHPAGEMTIKQSAGATAANAAFVAAHAVGRASVAEHGDQAYDDAFAAERAAQLEWLSARLAL